MCGREQGMRYLRTFINNYDMLILSYVITFMNRLEETVLQHMWESFLRV